MTHSVRKRCTEFAGTDNPLRRDLLTHPIHPRDVMVAVPTGPGLASELNVGMVKRYRVGA
jgi:L-alanine-DL-glutamate epimerase-like enolase superfamily enzyme